MNYTSQGIEYETENLTLDKRNRVLAEQEVLIMLRAAGYDYTMEQVKALKDDYIILVLDAENRLKEKQYLARSLVYLDPSYVIAAAIRSYSVSQSEREIIYNLLSKYFDAVRTPIPAIENWTSTQLVESLRTFQLPTQPSRTFTYTPYADFGKQYSDALRTRNNYMRDMDNY